MKKMNWVFGMMALLASASAMADGWVCKTLNNDLNVKVYDHVHAALGTRNAAVMVFSDPSVADGRKTIATFNDVEGTLANKGMTYLARADKAVDQGARGGEYIAGTRLMYVRDLTLVVHTSYSELSGNSDSDVAVRKGDIVFGTLTVEKLNGERIQKDLDCERYLKSN